MSPFLQDGQQEPITISQPLALSFARPTISRTAYPQPISFAFTIALAVACSTLAVPRSTLAFPFPVPCPALAIPLAISSPTLALPVSIPLAIPCSTLAIPRSTLAVSFGVALAVTWKIG